MSCFTSVCTTPAGFLIGLQKSCRSGIYKRSLVPRPVPVVRNVSHHRKRPGNNADPRAACARTVAPPYYSSWKMHRSRVFVLLVVVVTSGVYWRTVSSAPLCATSERAPGFGSAVIIATDGLGETVAYRQPLYIYFYFYF